MIIAAFTVTIIIPSSRSLKDKRRVIRSLKDRLRAKYNVAVAEVDGLDLWQRSTLAIVSVSNDEAFLNSVFSSIRNEIEGLVPGHIAEEHLEFL